MFPSVPSLFRKLMAPQTVSTICSFFLTMTLFPEVQRKAQEEIDTVIGTDRLPVLADRDNLPYVNALCKEVMRWNPVAPLGMSPPWAQHSRVLNMQ